MNIDQRLEAVVQSLELLTHDVRSLEQSTSTFQKTVEGSIKAQQDTNMRIVDSIERLVRLAQNHDDRISRLEDSAD